MRNRKSFARTIVLFIALQMSALWAWINTAPAAALTADELRETITILVKARDRILQKSPTTPPPGQNQASAQQDLLVFISYLDGRIYYYCEQLFDLGGADAVNKTTCPANHNGGLIASRYMMRPETSPRTTEEQLAELDASFSDSLGAFDEMLLREQQQVSASIKKQREEGGRAGTAADEAAGSGDSRNRSAKEDTAADNQAAGAGTKEQGRRPPTIGSTDLSQSDDDIVAKQLKEAAEQETDPEIKAKLWEEYRKYKAGTRQP